MKESTLRKLDGVLSIVLSIVLVLLVAAFVSACAYIVYHTYVW